MAKNDDGIDARAWAPIIIVGVVARGRVSSRSSFTRIPSSFSFRSYTLSGSTWGLPVATTVRGSGGPHMAGVLNRLRPQDGPLVGSL